jgi:hypothetical protein
MTEVVACTSFIETPETATAIDTGASDVLVKL